MATFMSIKRKVIYVNKKIRFIHPKYKDYLLMVYLKLLKMVGDVRFELTTPGFGGQYSIQLS